MDIKGLRTFLAKQENGVEMLDVLDGAIATEREKGISATKEVKRELSGAKAFKSAFDVLGYDADQGSPDDFAKSLKNTLDSAGEKDGQLTDTEARLNSLEKKWETERDARLKAEEAATASEQRAASKELTSTAMKSFTGKITTPEVHAERVVSNGLLVMDEGKPAWKDGSELAAGFETYVNQYPDAKVTTQTRGGGTPVASPPSVDPSGTQARMNDAQEFAKNQ